MQNPTASTSAIGSLSTALPSTATASPPQPTDNGQPTTTPPPPTENSEPSTTPAPLQLAASIREWDARIRNIHAKSTDTDWHVSIMSAFRCSILVSLATNFDDAEAVGKLGAIYTRLRKIQPPAIPTAPGQPNAANPNPAPSEPSAPPSGQPSELADNIQQWDPHLQLIKPAISETAWDRAILATFRSAILHGLTHALGDLETVENLSTLYSKISTIQLPQPDPFEQMTLEEHFYRIFGSYGNAKAA